MLKSQTQGYFSAASIVAQQKSVKNIESLRNNLSSWAMILFYQPAVYAQLH
jgi:hypothetical protein